MTMFTKKNIIKKEALKMLLSLFLAVFYSETAVSQSSTPKPRPTLNNWTSCESFVNNTVFDLNSVLDVDWKIFYFWNPDVETSYNIRFSRPSKMLVERFKVALNTELKAPLDWDDAELFMETSVDFSALYLKTNVSGVYKLVPTAAFDYTGIPTLIFGLKVVKLGYLGIANCKYRLCYALAPVDKMPAHDKLEEAALTLGFYSEYNRSYSVEALRPSTDQPDYDQREYDDEDLDVELDPNRLDLF